SDAKQHAAGHLFGFLFDFEAEFGHDFLKILPDVGLRGGIAKQVCRMVGGEHFLTAIVEPLASIVGNAAIGLEKCLKSCGTQADDHLRLDRVELAKKKRRTGGDLVWFGLAISWRAALDDVADVDVSPLEAHSFDHLCQEFSGASDEGQALRVFIGAWAFAD